MRLISVWDFKCSMKDENRELVRGLSRRYTMFSALSRLRPVITLRRTFAFYVAPIAKGMGMNSYREDGLRFGK